MVRYCLMMLMVFSIPLAVLAEDGSDESKKILYLLDKIEHSGAKFIRNGSEHDSLEAKKHLSRKLRKAGSRVKTADDFINKLASKSSFSGKVYHLKFADGTLTEVKPWLLEQLVGYKAE